MKCHRRANVPWNAVEHIADLKFLGATGFNDQMFLAVHHGLSIGQIEELDTRMRFLGGDGFVAQVQAKAIAAGLADDAGQNQSGI